jgi:hypothetical protein
MPDVTLSETARVLLREAVLREPVFAFAAAVLLAMIPLTLLAMVLDPRTLDGEGVWLKPLRFEVALAAYLGTLAVFAVWLPREVMDAVAMRAFAWAVVAAVAIEMIWIVGAALAGVRSHFNTTNRLLAALYPVMGLVAIFLTSAALVYGVAFLVSDTPALDRAVRLSLGLGCVLTFVLTVWVAGAMAGTGRPLHLAHFMATHAMHLLPVAGIAAAMALPAPAARIAVAAAAIAYVGLVWRLFVSAGHAAPPG